MSEEWFLFHHCAMPKSLYVYYNKISLSYDDVFGVLSVF